MKKGTKKNMLAIVERFIDDRWEFWGVFDSTIEGALKYCHRKYEQNDPIMDNSEPFRFHEDSDGWTYGDEFMLADGSDITAEFDQKDFRCQNVLVQRIHNKRNP